jgi:SAM-dependent methyltransferase
MRAKDYEFLYALEDDFWWFAGMREITAALLDPFCSSTGRPQCVLDAGCGTGGNLAWLERYAGTGSVIGIDLAEEALGFCRARHQRLVARASVTELPFTDSVFDLVTSFDVLGQLPCASSAENALREMHRVLRPGGIAFIRVAAYEWMKSDHDHALGNMCRYNLAMLVELTTQVGLKPLRSTYANTLLLPAAALRRLVLTRIGLSAKGSDVKPLSPSFHWLNSLLTSLLYKEAQWLQRPHTRLRIGLSAICVSEKPLF